MKKPLPDFFAIETGSELYVDPDFKPENNSLFWTDRGQTEADKWSYNNALWLRAYDP